MENKKKLTKHDINTKLVNEHLQLLLKRRKSKHIDEKICQAFNIEIQKEEETEYLF